MKPNYNVRKAAIKAGVSENTARKYLYEEPRLPSEIKAARSPRQYLTRESPFIDIFDEIDSHLRNETQNGRLVAKELFEYFQEKYPGKFQDSQLRTFQRLIKRRRVVIGKDKEVFFKQRHLPGELAESDFIKLKSIGIRVGGVLCEMLLYHYVLVYSTWEYFELCASESFESLSCGYQNAVFASGGVPARHQTDRLTAAVNAQCKPAEFTARYSALMKHYKVSPQKTNARRPNENGSTEVSHSHLKKAIIHHLEMRGSYDFKNHTELITFFKKINRKRNINRRDKFLEEKKYLKPLPAKKLSAAKKIKLTVSSGSTINIDKKIYSVQPKLIGEQITAQIFPDKIKIWFGGRLVETITRIFGGTTHKINYRHVIKWLVRKPGAFKNYCYKTDMFPTVYFRMAYEQLKKQQGSAGTKEYLKILEIAAFNSEEKVNNAIIFLIESHNEISLEKINELIKNNGRLTNELPAPNVLQPDLAVYDRL